MDHMDKIICTPSALVAIGVAAPGHETMGATSGLVTHSTLLGDGMNLSVAGAAMLLLVWPVTSKFSSAEALAGIDSSVQAAH